MVEIIVTMCLIGILLPFVFKTDDSFSDGDIVFKFSKRIRLLMFVCVIVFIIAFFGMSINALFYSDNKGDYLGVFIFFLFLVCSSFGYLFVRNKQIVCLNHQLYFYNIFGKKSVFDIRDIEKAVEYPSDGMKLTFKGGKKIKIDSLMSNYNKIKEILDKYHIVYKDRNGNVSPKGW